MNSCGYAYPECPSDPNRLIQYLNNHNGGFFRFFNGIQPTSSQEYAPQFPQYQSLNYQTPYPYSTGRAHAEDRIQNKQSRYISHNYVNQGHRVGFPRDENSSNDYQDTIRQPKRLNFPNGNQVPLKFPEDYPNRNPKFFNYNHNVENEILDFQRPLPNHKATKNIFPDRTGTGELKLDLEELEYKPSYEDDNVLNINGYINYRDYISMPYKDDYSTSHISFPLL